MLTNIVSAVANVGRYLVYTLAVQNCQVLSEGTGQLLINGPDKTKVFISGLKKVEEKQTRKPPIIKRRIKKQKTECSNVNAHLHLLKASMACFHSCSSNSTIPVRYAV